MCIKEMVHIFSLVFVVSQKLDSLIHAHGLN